jgi:tetraacyldisaccharide 4'-kinase
MTGTGPLPAALAPVAHLAAIAYGAGVRMRNLLWDHRAAARSGVPVVSIGNVAVGGTGKSPFVRWTVERLRDVGHRPMVALRGYGARDGLSDEAEEHRAMLPGTTVAVGGDRIASIRAARAADPAIDCVVLDDGFQHRALARDLDIVLVDASRPALDGPLLPAGWLREPASSLRRAGLVVVTRADAVDPRISALVERFHGKPPAAWTRHEWTRIERCGAGGRDMPIDALAGSKVVCVSALANPASFVDEASRRGARVRADLRFRDHHAFTASDASRIAAAARSHDAAVLCTGKDWAKLSRLVHDPAGVEWLVVRAGIRFVAGEDAVRARLAALFPARKFL